MGHHLWQWAQPASQLRWISLVKYNRKNPFCCFVYSYLCTSVFTTDPRSHHELHGVHDAPFLGEAPSVHLRVPRSSVGITWGSRQRDTPEPRRVPGKKQGGQGLLGGSGRVCAGTQQSKGSPCLTHRHRPGYAPVYPSRWHWWKRHVACKLDLFIVSC